MAPRPPSFDGHGLLGALPHKVYDRACPFAGCGRFAYALPVSGDGSFLLSEAPILKNRTMVIGAALVGAVFSIVVIWDWSRTPAAFALRHAASGDNPQASLRHLLVRHREYRTRIKQSPPTSERAHSRQRAVVRKSDPARAPLGNGSIVRCPLQSQSAGTRAALMVVYKPLIIAPKALTAAVQTTAMSATRMPYSVSTAPRSSFIKWTKVRNCLILIYGCPIPAIMCLFNVPFRRTLKCPGAFHRNSNLIRKPVGPARG
jgi:hypothetical protein